MKKTIYFIWVLFLTLLFTSCDDQAVVDLTLSTTDLEIKKHEIVTISVETGNGNYVVESSDEMIAKVAISGTTVAIYGVEGGSVTIAITDDMGKTETINVTVSFAVPSSSTFIWNKQSYSFDVPDGYGISILDGRVTLTNLDEYQQIILSWDGGLTEGEKTNAKLTFVEPAIDEESNEPVEITSFRVVRSDPVRGYYLVFNDGIRSGELFFTK